MRTFWALAAATAVAMAFIGTGCAGGIQTAATGKLEVADAAPILTVTDAKGTDGKPQASLVGQKLKIVGAMAAGAQKLVGKEVEVKGTVRGAELDAASIVEKASAIAPLAAPKAVTPAPAAPAAVSAPAPAPAPPAAESAPAPSPAPSAAETAPAPAAAPAAPAAEAAPAPSPAQGSAAN